MFHYKVKQNVNYQSMILYYYLFDLKIEIYI